MIEPINWGKHRVVPFSPNTSSSVVQGLRDGTVDGLVVSRWHGFKGHSLQFLRRLEGVKVVVVQGLPDADLLELAYLPELEELSVDETRQPIDLATLPKLKRLTLFWQGDLLRNAESSHITSLRLWKFKSKSNTLSELCDFKYINELALNQSPVRSLSGINHHRHLRDLELNYLPRLETLASLNLPELRRFTAANCRRLTDHEGLMGCANLEELRLHRCGAMKSLRFVDSLMHLKSFRFLGTDVLDHDLSPLSRLDDVFFSEKRGYSHRARDFKQSSKA